MKEGENNKNLGTVKDIYRFLLDNQFERNDLIIALGGGVVGDTAGYAAATYLRGIAFIQIPTSLLAQVDSSMGGKVGVNLGGYKNMIGAFYQPRLIYSNVQVLKTLNENQIRCAIAEMLIHAFIASPAMIDDILKNQEKIIVSRDSEVLERLVYENVRINMSVVVKDEKETGIRRILNLGHTFGHAIEAYRNYSYPHGMCVSIGLVLAFKIAEGKGLIKKAEVAYVTNVLKILGLPTEIEKPDWNTIFNNMAHDKKLENGKLIFVLPTKIGEVIQYPLKIDKELLEIITG
jgi:3-dehydroquinate synthase